MDYEWLGYEGEAIKHIIDLFTSVFMSSKLVWLKSH